MHVEDLGRVPELGDVNVSAEGFQTKPIWRCDDVIRAVHFPRHPREVNETHAGVEALVVQEVRLSARQGAKVPIYRECLLAHVERDRHRDGRRVKSMAAVEAQQIVRTTPIGLIKRARLVRVENRRRRRARHRGRPVHVGVCGVVSQVEMRASVPVTAHDCRYRQIDLGRGARDMFQRRALLVPRMRLAHTGVWRVMLGAG